jgi:hypothetical protein
MKSLLPSNRRTPRLFLIAALRVGLLPLVA